MLSDALTVLSDELIVLSAEWPFVLRYRSTNPRQFTFQQKMIPEQWRVQNNLLQPNARASLRAFTGSTPRRLCMIGLVVVYWRYTFSCGNRYSRTPNAANAASWKPLRINFFLPG